MKIIYSKADGRVAVVTLPDEATNIAVVPDSDIPQDRAYRDAWVITDGKIVVDPERAAEKQKEGG